MAGEEIINEDKEVNAEIVEIELKSIKHIPKVLSNDLYNSLCYFSNILFSAFFIYCSFYFVGTLVLPNW